MSNKTILTRLNNRVALRAIRNLLFAAMSIGLGSSALAGTFSFSNSNPIAINDTGNPPTTGSLYPSSISVSGLDGQSITHLSLTLNGLSHTYPSDLDIVLAGPSGQLCMLMSEVGGNSRLPVTDLTITLDDLAAGSLPIDSILTSGTFQPTRQFPTLSFEFPSPAPAGSSSAASSLSLFNGNDPNGTWNLFVVDESTPDSGTISGGWSMEVTTAVPEPGNFAFAALAVVCVMANRMWRKQERKTT